MALDQQRNWTVSMEKNFEKIMRLSRGRDAAQDDSACNGKLADDHSNDVPKDEPILWTTPPVHLPDEIILQILEYVATTTESQHTLASCCHLSRQWYAAAVPLLYRRPFLYGKNFDPFVRAICPSINLHVRKSPLAGLVKVLDMGNLVYQGSKSLTARLLGRTKESLEIFIAPQASFAMNCLAALSKCQHLRVLDLSLVSGSPPLPELFRSVKHLAQLETFRFPRSAGFGTNLDETSLSWPPHLADLCLSGGIDNNFLHGMVSFPLTLHTLTIEHCPPIKTSQLLDFLRTSVRRLTNLQALKIAYIHRIHDNGLDSLLMILPGLSKLSISVDYITAHFFDLREQMVLRNDEHSNYVPPVATYPRFDPQAIKDFSPPSFSSDDRNHTPGSRLHTLELTNSRRSGVEDKISPVDILIAIEDNSLFPNLKQVRVAKSLFWQSGENAREAEALTAALENLSAVRRTAGGPGDDAAEIGVWTFDG